MQRPVGSTVTDGRAELTDVWELFSNRFAIWAYIHVLLVGLTTAAVVIFGVSCWHLVRGRNQELFRHAAKLALIVGLPISAVNLGVGSQMGVVVTDYQPMKIASTEAQWDTCQPCAFSLFQIGGFTVDDQTPSFSIQVPHLLSILATLSWDGEVKGMNELQASEAATYGPGDYIPPTRTTYWSMRIMAYAGTLVFLVFALGAFLYRRGSLASRRWFLWLGVLTIPLPYAAALAGWVLSEVGRQPWIVWGLLKTADANSPSVSTATIATSLGVFVALYAALLVVDFVLMRRYARGRPARAWRRGRRVRPPGGGVLMDLQTFWFCLIVVVWAMYFLLEGFDFGVGMLLPFVPRSDEERSTTLRTIGPVWDANEVWLVVAGGATFAAFPAWYATMFSGFYLALLLILFFLIVRVVSFEWRSKSESPRWRAVWTWANTIGSLGAPLLWGSGCHASCTAPRSTRTATSPATSSICSAPTRVFAGIAVVALFAFHGATFLTLRTVGRAARPGGAHGAAPCDPGGRPGRRLRRLDGRRRDGPKRQGSLPARAPGRPRDRGPRARRPLHPARTQRKGVRDDGARDHRSGRDPVHEPLSARDGLEHRLREQPHRRQRVVVALRARRHERRRADLRAGRAPLPGLDVLRLPAPRRRRARDRRLTGRDGRRGPLAGSAREGAASVNA